MENFTIQINIIAISLLFIALALVLGVLLILFLVITFYFKFAAKASIILENLETTSYKTAEMANLLSDEVYKVTDRLDVVHSAFDDVISKFLYFSNFINGLRVPAFLRSIFSLFTSKDEGYNKEETILDEPKTRQTKNKTTKRRAKKVDSLDNYKDSDFDF